MIDVRDDLATALAGRYEIERELGHGGMAIVYLARDVRHDRHVAVKALRPELATTLGAERFLREINIAARLTHPNILALHDSGAAGGMLYFVMPHVDGESLRDRLDREHQLPMDEALAITRQIGLALDYAHERGVVHRDIKPENILLLGDHVLVADFGLARALYTAGTHRLTESAVAVGTPAYMSPEQAAADPDVDGRSDLYSLACVLFEMIAGMPPFKGATSAAVLAQHLTAKPPSICAQRPHCPPNVDAAVARALEKTPADRFRTAGEFVAALTGTGIARPPTSPVHAGRRRKLATRYAVASVVAALLLAGALALWLTLRHANAAPLSRTSYLVVPPVANGDAGEVSGTGIAAGIADALGSWDGIQVVDTRASGDDLSARAGRGDVNLADLRSVAQRLGAANVVWGDIGAGPAAGQRSVVLRVYDAETGQVLRQANLVYGREGPGRDAFWLMANEILRGNAEAPISGAGAPSRPSLSAWSAYDSARRALASWDLATAGRHLRAALAIEPSLPQANLWLSLVEMWGGQEPTRWISDAREAYDQRRRLAPGDTLLARAQVALAEAQFPEACRLYQQVAATDTTGVVGWYGLGECRSRDSLVVRDPSSRGGWRFRGSMNAALAAYLHIVDGTPPPQPAFVFARLSQLLKTTGNHVRLGHSAGSPRLDFAAYATLIGDSVAFPPYLIGPGASAGRARDPAGSARAVERNRSLIRRLYRSWAETAPSTSEAHAALAGFLESLEELGDSDNNPLSALGQIRMARTLTSDPSTRLNLAQTELRILVKRADWERAASFADSIFAANGRSAADSSLAGAAALTGRIRTLSQILRVWGGAPTFVLRMPNGAPLDVSPALAQDAAVAFAFALSGACVDSLRGYPGRVDRQLESYVPDPAERVAIRGVLLRRPLSMAVPCVGASALRGVDAAGDRMVMLEQALAVRDTNGMRAIFRDLAAARAFQRPGDNSMDYTYMESWMLAAIGDTAAAAARLDLSLDALPTLGPYLLEFPAHSAGLVRAMGLRAELAAAAGDRATTVRWASAVATLWAHADPELQPYVSRMRALAGHEPGAAADGGA